MGQIIKSVCFCLSVCPSVDVAVEQIPRST